mgnify:CR=1 FL=1
MQDPVGVKVVAAIEQLEHYTFDGGRRNRVARLLGVVMDDLEQVVLGVVEYHKDALVFEDDLDETNDIGVAQFAAQAHLADGTLGDARIANLFTLLVGLELFDSHLMTLARLLSRGQSPTHGLVHPSICTTADEAHNSIAFCDAGFGLVGVAA